MNTISLNNLLPKAKLFFATYKWLLFPIVPIVVFILLLIFAFSTPKSIKNQPTISPTQPTPNEPFPSQEANNPTGTEKSFDQQLDDAHSFSTDPGLLKKESLPDGSTEYSYSSSNPSRPRIVIAKGAGEDDGIFERNLSTQDIPLSTISVYKQAYGEPERVIQGSAFYGQQANIYIYGSLGVAFIGNPTTDEVFEEQLFKPMTPDQYLQKYGDMN